MYLKTAVSDIVLHLHSLTHLILKTAHYYDESRCEPASVPGVFAILGWIKNHRPHFLREVNVLQSCPRTQKESLYFRISLNR